jgi:uncharacterized protein with NRDE domain
MCLIGLALDADPRFPLVVAANRDEFFDRPTAALDWWCATPDGPWLLGGRDLTAGGTWLGLSQGGRVGMLTNVRDPARQRADAASRGGLVTAWLEGRDMGVAPYNPYNLVGGDLHDGRWWVRSDRDSAPVTITPGLHVLSNAALNTPWPKARRLNAALAHALDTAGDVSDLEQALWELLGDRSSALDEELPDTGVGRDLERMLSPVFIAAPDGRYGTRCSTLIIGQRDERDALWRLRVVERTHDRGGRSLEQRSVTLEGWPHRNGDDRPAVSVLTL